MWLLPSRRRPENLCRFFEAYQKTGSTTPGMVLIDESDWLQEPHPYCFNPPPGWHWGITRGETQAEKIDEVWDQVKDCAWLGLIGDDCVPETQLWDRKLLDHLDRALIISCDDGWQAPKRLGNCWVIKGELVREVGYIFPPGMQHLFVDDVWERIGQGSGSWHCCMDVMVRHKHVLKGEAPVDETHELVYGEVTAPPLTGGFWASDRLSFESWEDEDEARCVAAARALQPEPVSPVANDDAVVALVEKGLARARSRKVMLATPVHRDTAWQYTIAFVETFTMFRDYGISLRAQFQTGSSNLPKARNELVDRFLKSDCDDLLFVDADMGWDASAAVRLIMSEHEVIGAVGRKKWEGPLNDPQFWCVGLIPGTEHQIAEDERGSIEVERVGTGFLKIARSAFERIAAERPRKSDLPYYRFFAFGPDDEGEDYEFCKLWRSIGGEIWVDPAISLKHVGDKEYEGRFGDVLRVAPEPLREAAEMVRIENPSDPLQYVDVERIAAE